jgi:hypothetical protein
MAIVEQAENQGSALLASVVVVAAVIVALFAIAAALAPQSELTTDDAGSASLPESATTFQSTQR